MLLWLKNLIKVIQGGNFHLGSYFQGTVITGGALQWEETEEVSGQHNYSQEAEGAMNAYIA